MNLLSTDEDRTPFWRTCFSFTQAIWFNIAITGSKSMSASLKPWTAPPWRGTKHTEGRYTQNFRSNQCCPLPSTSAIVTSLLTPTSGAAIPCNTNSLTANFHQQRESEAVDSEESGGDTWSADTVLDFISPQDLGNTGLYYSVIKLDGLPSSYLKNQSSS